MRQAVITLALALLCVSHAEAAAPTAEIKAVLERARTAGEFNGVALVAQHGNVIYEAPHGFADAARSKALAADYRFNIGSIAKEFSAVAIMQLVEQGRLQLDDNVRHYLDYLPAWSEKITIRMLLDYTSGLPEMSWRTVKTDLDAREDIRLLEKLSFEPGTAFGYTYNNVMLRQFVVEQITGDSFSAYVRKRVVKHCGLRDAIIDATDADEDIAWSFSDAGKQDSTELPVSGIVFVTARDLLRWSECLNRNRAISAKSLSLLGHSFNPRNGGLGSTLWSGDVLISHAHNGESRNSEALLRADLQRGTTIILLSNNKHQKLDGIADAITAALEGKKP